MNTVKSGDRVITAVSYEDPKSRKRIASVRVQIYNGYGLGPRTVMTRQEVVSAMRYRQVRFLTAYDRFGRWVWGEDVRIFTRNNVDYLRSDANNIEADNLGELPEF